MAEGSQPVGEDFSKSMEDLAEYAGEVALEMYRSELDKGLKKTQAFSRAIEVAKNVMMDAGCPLELCDLLADAAINGYNSFIQENPNGDPMEAFEAAGEFVNDALESELKNSWIWSNFEILSNMLISWKK